VGKESVEAITGIPWYILERTGGDNQLQDGDTSMAEIAFFVIL